MASGVTGARVFFRLRLTLHIRPIPITDPVSTDELGNFTPQVGTERGTWQLGDLRVFDRFFPATL